MQLGAVYTALNRLEDERLVESWTGEPTAERGGRAKRYFRVTSRGMEAGAHSRHWWRCGAAFLN